MDNYKNNVFHYKSYVLYYFLYYLTFYFKKSSCRWVPPNGNTVYYNEIVLNNSHIKPITITDSQNYLSEAVVFTQVQIMDTNVNTRLFSSGLIDPNNSLINFSIKHECGQLPTSMHLRYLVLFKSTYIDKDNAVVMHINFLTVPFIEVIKSYVVTFNFPDNVHFNRRPNVIARLQANESFQHSISIQNVAKKNFSFALKVSNSMLLKLKHKNITIAYIASIANYPIDLSSNLVVATTAYGRYSINKENSGVHKITLEESLKIFKSMMFIESVHSYINNLIDVYWTSRFIVGEYATALEIEQMKDCKVYPSLVKEFESDVQTTIKRVSVLALYSNDVKKEMLTVNESKETLITENVDDQLQSGDILFITSQYLQSVYSTPIYTTIADFEASNLGFLPIFALSGAAILIVAIFGVFCYTYLYKFKAPLISGVWLSD